MILLPPDLVIELFLYLPISKVLELCFNSDKYPGFGNICHNETLWKRLWQRDFSDILPVNQINYFYYKDCYLQWNAVYDLYDKAILAVSRNWEKKICRSEIYFRLCSPLYYSILFNNLFIVKYLTFRRSPVGLRQGPEGLKTESYYSILSNLDVLISSAKYNRRTEIVEYLKSCRNKSK